MGRSNGVIGVVSAVEGVVMGVVEGGVVGGHWNLGHGCQLGSFVDVGNVVSSAGQSVGWSHALYAVHFV